MAKQTRKQAVEERTQQRLAARKEAARKSAETRRAKFERQHPEVAEKKAALKKHEAKLVVETRKMLDAEAAAEAQAEQPKPAPTAPQAPKAEKPQPQGAERFDDAQHRRQTKRPGRSVPSTVLGTGAQDKPASNATLRSSDASSLRSTSRGAMATAALRGEQAQHFRALAASQGLSLSKLLVRMMEVFEAQGR